MSTDDKESAIVAQLTEIQPRLRSYVQSLMPGDSAAADITQQANQALWKKRNNFELGTNFTAWAFQIARYEVLNFRKKQARDSRLVFSPELEQVFADEIGTCAVSDREQALKICLDGLKASDRQLLLHRYQSGSRLSEYAESTGRTVGGLKTTLHRLRAALARCIEAKMQKGGAL